MQESERSEEGERKSGTVTESTVDLKKSEFVGQASLKACKPTAEGLMMPGPTLSLFTKTHVAVFTVAAFLCLARGQKTQLQYPNSATETDGHKGKRGCVLCTLEYAKDEEEGGEAVGS